MNQTVQSELGDAPAHRLFDLIQVEPNDPSAPARGFGDFTVTAPAAGALPGFPRVALDRIVG